ncbi:MAG TPA: D-alanine--D-alanine ligase A [Lachnospiraceae bacterium]|uniref:D-alanine--D-alanine ligase family protein n=1 Tax=Anaerosporobacter sp. TaxID=1872529 RepID=UPI000EE24FD7|nr:D-alanine--D-alanine ligase family protein [Anaerosporobacter sp.]HAB62365.1 D-alanine--D-alanine ligase A [Lachnospiraceae bacterium]
MSKKSIAVIFGGKSSEHEVSCVSAVTVIENIDTDAYNLVLIGITKEGKWLRVGSTKQITSGEWYNSKDNAILSPDASHKGILIIKDNKVERIAIDVVFPVLHGLNGEDGTIQGLLELSGIPYVGCGVLASSISMDKLYTKIVVDTLNIRQAEYVAVLKSDMRNIDKVIANVEEKLKYPVFVKPSNAGSSQGVSKAQDRDELIAGLQEAIKHDRKVLVEETIIGREIECAILGGSEPKASGVGEILAAAEFYDYEAKYHNAESKTVISPEIPKDVEEKIRESAVRIFKAIDGYGLSRVDFFVEKDTNDVVFNEINTLPGFTSISMYPMLWEARGISKKTLVEKMIQSAYSRKGD